MAATEKYYLAQVEELQAKVLELEKELVLGLNSAEAKVRDLEMEKRSLLLRQTDLEMALDLARSKSMAKE